MPFPQGILSIHDLLFNVKEFHDFLNRDILGLIGKEFHQFFLDRGM